MNSNIDDLLKELLPKTATEAEKEIDDNLYIEPEKELTEPYSKSYTVLKPNLTAIKEQQRAKVRAEHLRDTEHLRIALNKCIDRGEPIERAFIKAVEIIGLLLDDQAYSREVIEKSKAVYRSIGIAELTPYLQLEKQEAELEQLETVLKDFPQFAEHTKPFIQQAIREHKAEIEKLQGELQK